MRTSSPSGWTTQHVNPPPGRDIPRFTYHPPPPPPLKMVRSLQKTFSTCIHVILVVRCQHKHECRQSPPYMYPPAATRKTFSPKHALEHCVLRRFARWIMGLLSTTWQFIIIAVLGGLLGVNSGRLPNMTRVPQMCIIIIIIIIIIRWWVSEVVRCPFCV